jgi:hypothetical protein
MALIYENLILTTANISGWLIRSEGEKEDKKKEELFKTKKNVQHTFN